MAMSVTHALAAALAHDRPVVSVEVAWSPRHTLQELGTALSQLAQELQLERLVLLGLGGGGAWLAAAMANLAEQQVVAVVLVNSAWDTTVYLQRLEMARLQHNELLDVHAPPDWAASHPAERLQMLTDCHSHLWFGLIGWRPLFAT
jgi:pimeloyl-ACP methyl ester carboxylesterase